MQIDNYETCIIRSVTWFYSNKITLWTLKVKESGTSIRKWVYQMYSHVVDLFYK